VATLALDRPAPENEEPPLQRNAGRVALSGNELIVKGALEGGVSLITGYPGSPVADVFTICERAAPYLRALGVEATLANNEAQSAAMLNGARQVPGARPMAVFKSVGAYVALDGLAIANSALPAAGAAAVVVVGDDPEMTSTQVGADSRLTLAAARIPVLEPSSWQDIKDLVAAAFELSVESELVVAVMLTTPQADGAGVVELRPNRPPAVGPLRRVELDTRAVQIARAVSLPPQVTNLEQDLVGRRLPLLQEGVRARGLDALEGPRRRSPLGFVTAGASYALLRHALDALGVDGRLPLLRLALTSPVDPEAVRRLGELAEEVVVVEERSGHLEDQVRRALGSSAQPVWGKRFPDEAPGVPEAGSLDPDRVAAAIARLALARPEAFGAEAAARARELVAPPRPKARPLPLLARTPTYCAGCPHRGTNSPMLEIRERLRDPEYMRRVHGREPVELIAHGGIGCYSMAVLPPFEEMHDLSAMGLGGATGAGSAPHTTNKHYTLVGDGTFFHGEMSTIANAIKQRQDILFIILDNKSTAMTGHQGTPGSERDLMGRPQAPLEIERIVAAMGPSLLARSNPDDREAHMALLERAVLAEGTRVVIADKECAITSGRRTRAARARVEAEHGFLPEVTRINVVEEACENCRACTTATGCPGLTVVKTPFGEKVGIDDQTCVDDGYCAAIKACPSFERVTVTRRAAPTKARRARPRPPEPDLPQIGAGELAIQVAGVGGLGIALVTRVVAEAAAESFPGVDVYQKRGLAQRGGAVYSQLVLHDGTRARSPVIPRGRADLIIGLDALEGTRALDVASPDRTAAVVDTHRRQTTTSLMGAARYPDDLRERLSAGLRPGGLLALNLSEACGEELGDAIYANVAALGAAWQRGWLPLEGAALERAIRSVYGAHAEANLAAFELGRALAVEEPAPRPVEDVEATLAREEGWIRRRRDRRAFRDAIARARDLPLGDHALGMLAPRLPELLAWGGPEYAGRYLDGIARVAAAAPALIPAAIHNLHRAMAIKDEVFVAHQLTSPRKLARDRERFDVDPKRGDRISYVHLNRPSFEVLGRTIRWDAETRDWQLRLFARARVLRRLLPAWHARERAFRDWYEGEVIGAVADGRLTGEAAHEALRLPETVNGYREIRYPKEDAAYARFAELLESASA
jgi:indolepyruvate ferredoxin oxidoreductase